MGHVVITVTITVTTINTKRHDSVCVLNCTVTYGWKQGGNQTTDSGMTMYRNWQKQVRTDRTIPNNKPDIIIRDNKQVTCMSIDAVIPEDGNVIKTEAEKILTLRLPD